MILIILGIALGITIGVLAADGWYDNKFEYGFWGGMFGLGGGVLLAILIGLFANPTITNQHDTAYIGNLNDGTAIHGSNFLFSGRVDEHDVYRYYKETGNNQYKLHTLIADDSSYDVTIITDSPKKPYIETVGDVAHAKTTLWYIGIGEYFLKHVYIHVPKDSIEPIYLDSGDSNDN